MIYRGRTVERSRSIVERIRDGQTNGQIGEALGLARNSIRTYVTSLCAEYDVHNRAALVAAAIDAGFVSPYTPKKKRA